MGDLEKGPSKDDSDGHNATAATAESTCCPVLFPSSHKPEVLGLLYGIAFRIVCMSSFLFFSVAVLDQASEEAGCTPDSEGSYQDCA